MSSKISKQNTGVSNIVRGKSISLNIKEEGVLEGNVIQIPFIAEYRYKNNPITNIDYEWTTNAKDGSKIKRGLKVSGHGQYGVPTLREKEVLRCLHNIFVAQKTKDGIFELKHPDECSKEDYAISFTIDSLCKEIGYKSPCNQTRDNVRRSLEILVATTIFNRHSGGLYDPEKKEYITNQKMAFHLIETLMEEELLDDKGNIVDDITQIRLSGFVYKSLYNNYKLIYNKSRVNSIKHLGAKSLYQVALQWSRNGVTYAGVDKLTEQIPMKDGIGIVQKRKYIKACLKKIDGSGFVSVDIDKRNLVKFTFKDLVKKIKVDDIDEMFTTYEDMLNGVIGLGYMRAEAKSIMNDSIIDLSGVQKALRQVYALHDKDSGINMRDLFEVFYVKPRYEQMKI